MAATQKTPLPADDNFGPTAISVCTVLLAICLLFYTIRIVTRVTPVYRLKATDYVVSAALVLEILAYSFFFVAISFGTGRPPVYVSPEDAAQANRWTFGVAMAGLASASLARISITLLLFEFRAESRAWKTILWLTIVIQVLVLAESYISILTACRPARALWAHVPDARCISEKATHISLYTFSATALLGDVLCTILPLFVISKLKRSVLERSLMCFLASLSTLATGASCVRTFYDLTTTSQLAIYAPFWCRIETLLLLIASSCPFLKSACERVFSRFHLPTFHNVVRDIDQLNSGGSTDGISHEGGQHELAQLEGGTGEAPDKIISTANV